MADCANPGHGDAGTTCAGCAQACEAELTALNDRYMRLLGDQRASQTRSAASARRAAQDHMRAFAHLILGPLMEELTFPVRPALYRATQVDPDRGRTAAERAQLGQLRNAAETALRAWDERTSREQAAAAFAADPREAEITRLRALIVAAGQRVHREVAEEPCCVICGAFAHDPETTCTGTIPGRPPGWACTCPGCELIRAMDTEGLPDPSQEVA